MSAPAPAPKPPGVGELFEQSLIAVVDPSVFRRAAARPAPGFGTSAAFAAATGAAALAIGVAHAIVANPGLPQAFPPAVLAAVAVAALGLYASLFLLLAVLLYGAGGALGGKGEFERGLQAAAMLSALAPAQMLCTWFPAAWAVPALLAAWVAACALEGLFDAKPAPARVLCFVAAFAAIGLQYAGRSFVDRYAAVALAPAQVPDAELVRSASALAQQAAAMSAAASASMASSASNTPVPAAAPATATSGLDLLRGSVDDGAPAAAPAPAPGATPATAPSAPAAGAALPTDAATRAMQASASGMLDALTPMLNMVTSLPNLKPEQKADIKELQSLMADLKQDMAANKKLDDAVFKAKMQRYQALLVRVMSYGPPPSGAAASQPSTVHLQVPQEGR